MRNANSPALFSSGLGWWEHRRLRYNALITLALVVGFFAYVAIVNRFAPVIGRPIINGRGELVGNDIEFGGIEGMMQCCGAGVYLLLANLFYFLGRGIEPWIPSSRVAEYRKWAWRAGTAFSCFLPCSISLTHLVLCLFFPSAYDRTPIRV